MYSHPGRTIRAGWFLRYIRTGSLLKTSLLDVYNCLCYPMGRTLRPSVECLGGGGGGRGTFYPSGGQFALVQNVRGGHCALVQNVRGDILHGGTIRPPTPVLLCKQPV